MALGHNLLNLKSMVQKALKDDLLWLIILKYIRMIQFDISIKPTTQVHGQGIISKYRRTRPRPPLWSEMLPSLRIIFYRLCNLFSPGYTWKHGLRKPSNKVFFFQTYCNCFGIFGPVDCVVLCGILITFSLHILSLLPSR